MDANDARAPRVLVRDRRRLQFAPAARRAELSRA
jgi:hypothetical protein